MKPIHYGRPLALLLGALLFIAAHADVTIKSVDNYAGNSNVYTSSLNTTIKVIELDADKKPVRSWTGTTDGEGKLTIPAGHNLSLPYLRAENADPRSAEFADPSSVVACLVVAVVACGGEAIEGFLAGGVELFGPFENALF